MKRNSKKIHLFLAVGFLSAVPGMAGIVFVPREKLFVAGGNGNSSWPSDASGYRFHMIGHAHIDPVWLWPWHEGMAVVHSTFRSALDRMNETSDFAFVASSAQFYEWVAENDPVMIKEIGKRVDEGRWNIVGGWWVEPDVNIPCGESMARQGLYGQRTFQCLFGRKARVAFNPDLFDMPVPCLKNLQGDEILRFHAACPHEKTLPAELFWWESTTVHEC